MNENEILAYYWNGGGNNGNSRIEYLNSVLQKIFVLCGGLRLTPDELT